MPLGTWSADDQAEHALFALLSLVPNNTAFAALHQLTTPLTKACYFEPNTHTMRTLMAQMLADEMLSKGLTPMDMVLLYAWAG